MASVYRAFDHTLGRIVALKIFRVDVTDAADLRRQRDEVTFLATLNHPGLVTLYNAVLQSPASEADRGFLVMEYIDGSDLSWYLTEGPLLRDEIAPIGASIADALSRFRQPHGCRRPAPPPQS